MTSQFEQGYEGLPGSPSVARQFARPFNTFNILQQDKAAQAGNYVESDFTIRDVGGGLNCVRGFLQPHYLGMETADSHRTSSANGLDPSQPGQLILCTKMVSEAVWKQTAHFCWAMFNNELVIGANATTANLSLYQEQGAGNPVLTAVTYTPANKISCLFRTWLAGNEYLIVGMEGTAADVLNTSFASNATMAAATSSLWGIIRSPINATVGTETYLIYSGTGTSATITTLSSTAAFATAPTSASSNLNGGGYAVGMANVALTPGNMVARAVWVMPEIGLSASMMTGSPDFAPRKGKIIHTNLEGTDPQPLITRLSYVYWCIVHDGVLYYTDGRRIMMNNGIEHDLGWVSEREPNGNVWYFAVGLGVANGSLITQAVRLDKINVANTTIQYEKLDERTKTWQPLSVSGLLGTSQSSAADAGPNRLSQAVTCYPMGSLAWSQDSYCLHHLPRSSGTASDFYQFVPPDGYSQFWLYRRTAGSAGAGTPMEASGTWDSPAWLLPHPLSGLPTVITAIDIMSDVAAGGAGGTTTQASVQWQQATQSIGGTFSYSGGVTHRVYARDSLDYKARHREFGPKDWDPFTLLKLRATCTASDANNDWSPNALPVRIRMRTFLSGERP